MKPLTGRAFFPTLLLVAFSLPMAGESAAQEFTYQPPGTLVDGSGTGRVDHEVYVPGMRFPIENSPAYPNSQVWGHGGMNGPGGGQCHADNYSYPWWDNYCETRQWTMPLCPGGTGHQGQDIRPSTCEDKAHWAVAAEDGTITGIGTYSVNLMTADGTRHRYLHMDPPTLAVGVGDTVQKGQRLGLVSNAFGGTPTTIHLHYDIQRNVAPHGTVYVPTYMSLVRSYQDLIGQPETPCGFIGATGGVIDNQDDCFRLMGNIGTWRTESSGHDGSLYWTYAYDGAQPDGYARWTLHIEEPGDYEVAVFITPEFAQSTQTRYVLRAGGSNQELRLDQSAADGWTSLGTFSFAGDDDEWLEIYDNTGEPFADRLQFVADALRLSPDLPDEPGAPDAGPDTPDAGSQTDAGLLDDAGPDPAATDASHTQRVTTSSCSTAPASPSPLLFIVVGAGLLLVRWRRIYGPHDTAHPVFWRAK